MVRQFPDIQTDQKSAPRTPEPATLRVFVLLEYSQSGWIPMRLFVAIAYIQSLERDVLHSGAGVQGLLAAQLFAEDFPKREPPVDFR